jgi:hypothetical protein
LLAGVYWGSVERCNPDIVVFNVAGGKEAKQFNRLKTARAIVLTRLRFLKTKGSVRDVSL